MKLKHPFRLAVLLLIFLSQTTFAFEPHYVRHDPGHFCWGAGINAELYRGALYGRFWINDFVGMTFKGYTNWNVQGVGGLAELKIKVPLQSGLRPYALIGFGYHIEQIDTVFSEGAHTEWLSFQTLRYGVGAEYRFGDNQKHGLGLEVAYFDGGSNYYSIDSSGFEPDSIKHSFDIQPLSLAFQYSFYYCGTPSKDEDNDGYHNRDENCPYTAEDFDGFMDDDGCPEYDNDMDGVPDSIDQCINDHEDLDGFEDEDGCPEYNNDGDHAPDSTDSCPNEAEDLDQFEDEDGCPELDNDQDSILDNEDNCPLIAEDIDGYEDEDGCPEEDNDSDGILDVDDQCPDEAENFNDLRDEDGCRDTIIVITKEPLELKSVSFGAGSDSLLDESYHTLEDVIHSLKLWEEVRIEIQGHTDALGSDEFNMTLSQQRADAIKAFFIEQGIDNNRLEAVGYGETVPVGDNNNADGRAMNRRVELIQID